MTALPIREQFDLRPDHTLVLALPPIARPTGAFVLAWATLLLEKIRPDVRLIVPGTGREVDRIEWLVYSCRHSHIVRFCGDDFPLPALLAAADLAAYLPHQAVSLTNVQTALEVGRPLIITALPLIQQFLATQKAAAVRLCRPNNPKDTARQLLHLLEQTEQQKRAVKSVGF